MVLQITVGAFFPDTIGEAIKEELAFSGFALEDLQELLKRPKRNALRIARALDSLHL